MACSAPGIGSDDAAHAVSVFSKFAVKEVGGDSPDSIARLNRLHVMIFTTVTVANTVMRFTVVLLACSAA